TWRNLSFGEIAALGISLRLAGVDSQQRGAVGVGSGLFDVVPALNLEDFRQFPATVEAGNPLQRLSRDGSGIAHQLGLPVSGETLGAPEIEKPTTRTERDNRSGFLFGTVAQPLQRALEALACR